MQKCSVIEAKQSRLMYVSNFAVCGKNSWRFFKNKKASVLKIKTP